MSSPEEWAAAAAIASAFAALLSLATASAAVFIAARSVQYTSMAWLHSYQDRIHALVDRTRKLRTETVAISRAHLGNAMKEAESILHKSTDPKEIQQTCAALATAVFQQVPSDHEVVGRLGFLVDELPRAIERLAIERESFDTLPRFVKKSIALRDTKDREEEHAGTKWKFPGFGRRPPT